MTGIITSIVVSDRSSFGFLKGDEDGYERYFHEKECAEFGALWRGAFVTFTPTRGGRMNALGELGYRAKDVELATS